MGEGPETLFKFLSRAAENIAFPLKEHTSKTQEEIDEIVERLLELVNLQEAKDKLPHELSGGMQRRLGIARALALNPKIVFYDDPTAGQDPIRSDEMAKRILELKNQYNSTLITVTSDLMRAYQMADRIFMVVNNEVLEVGGPQELKNNLDPRVQQFIHGYKEGPIQYT